MVQGYNVVYRYNGRDIATRLPYNPGPTVQLGIGVISGGPGAQPGYPVPAGVMGPPPVVSGVSCFKTSFSALAKAGVFIAG